MKLLQYLKDKNFAIYDWTREEKEKKAKLERREESWVGFTALFLVFCFAPFMLYATYQWQGAGFFGVVALFGLQFCAFHLMYQKNQKRIQEICTNRERRLDKAINLAALELYENREMLHSVVKEMMDIGGADKFKENGYFLNMFKAYKERDFTAFKQEIGTALLYYWEWTGPQERKSEEVSEYQKEMDKFFDGDGNGYENSSLENNLVLPRSGLSSGNINVTTKVNTKVNIMADEVRIEKENGYVMPASKYLYHK